VEASRAAASRCEPPRATVRRSRRGANGAADEPVSRC
jgi:hypothetical protein